MTKAVIRALAADADLDAVAACLTAAQDYYLMAEGSAPTLQTARDFFTDAPPGCDPAAAHHLGLFVGGRLCGLAELSFGFPAAGDAYLGLMILDPALRGQGLGPGLLVHVEGLARGAGAPALYLGVLQANTRGRAFWDRHGFTPTGVSRTNTENGLTHVIHRLVKPL